MKLKLFITLFITFCTLLCANAQTQSERVPTTEVIRLVSDAHTNNNTIYNERIKGHEDEQADLRKVIYSANTELMAIRSLLAGNKMVKRADYVKLEQPLAELKTAIEAVRQSVSDADLQKAVSNVISKAKMVKKVIQKITK